MELQIIDIIEDTTVDGPGFRTSIYCSGCHHACPGCHNPQSWDEKAGKPMSVEHLLETILADPFADVTFSGGDPMYQAEGFAELAKAIKEQSDKTIWCYTGFTFEALMMRPATRNLLQYIDVLVDGPFIQTQRDEDLLYRGSTNQRLIDVQSSLQQHQLVIWHSPMVLAS